MNYKVGDWVVVEPRVRGRVKVGTDLIGQVDAVGDDGRLTIYGVPFDADRVEPLGYVPCRCLRFGTGGRSREGENIRECDRPAKFIVTERNLPDDGGTHEVYACGVHVKRERRMHNYVSERPIEDAK